MLREPHVSSYVKMPFDVKNFPFVEPVKLGNQSAAVTMEFERKLRYHYKVLGVKDAGEKYIIQEYKKMSLEAMDCLPLLSS